MTDKPITNDRFDDSEDSVNAIVWRRVDFILDEILKNDHFLEAKRGKELIDKVCKKFNIAPRTASKNITLAKKEIKKLSRENRKEAYRKAMIDREYIIRDAKSGGDNKLALDAMKDRDKIRGLYVENIKESGEITVKNVDMAQFTEYGLEKLKRGETLESVLLDPKSLKQNNADTDANRR